MNSSDINVIKHILFWALPAMAILILFGIISTSWIKRIEKGLGRKND